MQTSLSELEYAAKKKLTRRDRFLAELEAITPWSALESTLAPFYPSEGGRGRQQIGLNRMLRMYIAQQCFGLSDEGIEDAIYDSQAIRRFPLERWYLRLSFVMYLDGKIPCALDAIGEPRLPVASAPDINVAKHILPSFIAVTT